MSTFTNSADSGPSAGSGPVLVETASREKAGASAFPGVCKDSLTIPSRGIVSGLLASGVLWAAILLAARALGLLLR